MAAQLSSHFHYLILGWRTLNYNIVTIKPWFIIRLYYHKANLYFKRIMRLLRFVAIDLQCQQALRFTNFNVYAFFFHCKLLLHKFRFLSPMLSDEY